MDTRRLHFVLDVESVGLYGEAFAFGAVLLDGAHEVQATWLHACNPRLAEGTADAHEWVRKHVHIERYDLKTPRDVRSRLFEALLYAKRRGAAVWADVSFPVETNVLARVRGDDPGRRDPHMPFPLLDVGTVQFAAGIGDDEFPRRPEELPAHNPLADAKHSARKLITCLQQLVVLPQVDPDERYEHPVHLFGTV